MWILIGSLGCKILLTLKIHFDCFWVPGKHYLRSDGIFDSLCCSFSLFLCSRDEEQFLMWNRIIQTDWIWFDSLQFHFCHYFKSHTLLYIAVMKSEKPLLRVKDIYNKGTKGRRGRILLDKVLLSAWTEMIHVVQVQITKRKQIYF